MSSLPVQEEIDKAKSTKVKRIRITIGAGVGYAVAAHLMSGIPEMAQYFCHLQLVSG